MSDDKKFITAEEKAEMKEFLEAMERLRTHEPERIPAEEWDKVWPRIQETGEVPEEYRDRIGKSQVKDNKTGEMQPGYYDKAWEDWNREMVQLAARYNDIIIKALQYAISNEEEQQSLIDMLQQLISENTEDIPAVIVRKLESIDFPIDKVNKDIWRLLEPTDGQLTYAARYNVARKGSKKPIDILYSLDFENLENVSITRRLEPYDKRIYLAVAALFNSGYDYMSVQQIYNAAGYTGRMSATDIKKINTAISKMNGAHLLIDNLAESKTYKYDHFRYDGVLLPMERVQAMINGQIADAAIHVFREPPMVSFARERKQITTIDIKLLDTPLSKTNSNIELEDYLLEEIARIKKGGRNRKMLYKTIYENANVTTKKQKQRAPEKIKKLLDYYQKCQHITGYEESSDGVTILC